MKKIFYFAALLTITVLFYSCGSTKNVAYFQNSEATQ